MILIEDAIVVFCCVLTCCVVGCAINFVLGYSEAIKSSLE